MEIECLSFSRSSIRRIEVGIILNCKMLSPAPSVDPVHDYISSEKYIESLEKKLKKVAGQSNKEPTSKDIIKSLEQCKEASMRRLLDSSNGTSQPQDYSEAVVNKTHQGQQQDVEEIVAIVYQDQLAAHSTEHSAQHTVTEHTEQDPSLQQR